MSATAQSTAKVRIVEIDANHAGQRIDNFLLSRLKGVPKSRIYRILRKGEVRVNKKRIKPVYKLCVGDQVRIPPVRMAEAGEAVPIPDWAKQAVADVLFEDEALLVINKPSGMAVHGGSGLAFGVIEVLRDVRSELSFLELAHRLDRETSGVLMLAKGREALVGLQAQLRRETQAGVSKSYIAILSGAELTQVQTVTTPLRQVINNQGKKMMLADEAVDGQVNEGAQQAKSVFLPMEVLGNEGDQFSLTRIQLHTGRMHQARAHAQSIGRAIVGDAMYGDWDVNKRAKQWKIQRTQLHSESYAFLHPISNKMLKITAPMAADMAASITFINRKIE